MEGSGAEDKGIRALGGCGWGWRRMQCAQLSRLHGWCHPARAPHGPTLERAPCPAHFAPARPAGRAPRAPRAPMSTPSPISSRARRSSSPAPAGSPPGPITSLPRPPAPPRRWAQSSIARSMSATAAARCCAVRSNDAAPLHTSWAGRGRGACVVFAGVGPVLHFSERVCPGQARGARARRHGGLQRQEAIAPHRLRALA